MDHVILTKLLGSGAERDCWLHPADSSLVVKTIRQARKGRCQNLQDDAYYRWLRHTGRANAHIPRIVGWCDTQFGRGLVCSRAMNADGTPSIDLAKSLQARHISLDEAGTLIANMFAVFLKHGIMVSDNNPKNFFCVHDTDGSRLVIVDGFGHRRINLKSRLRDTFAFLANRQTTGRWQKLLHALPSDCAQPFRSASDR